MAGSRWLTRPRNNKGKDEKGLTVRWWRRGRWRTTVAHGGARVDGGGSERKEKKMKGRGEREVSAENGRLREERERFMWVIVKFKIR